MKWLKRLFSKVEIRHLVFNMCTDDTKHYEFIEWVNKSDVEIINSFTTYHKVGNSHIPAYIHYIVKIRNLQHQRDTYTSKPIVKTTWRGGREVDMSRVTFPTKEKQSANVERQSQPTLHWDSLPTPNELNKRMKKKNENTKSRVN